MFNTIKNKFTSAYNWTKAKVITAWDYVVSFFGSKEAPVAESAVAEVSEEELAFVKATQESTARLVESLITAIDSVEDESTDAPEIIAEDIVNTFYEVPKDAETVQEVEAHIAVHVKSIVAPLTYGIVLYNVKRIFAIIAEAKTAKSLTLATVDKILADASLVAAQLGIEVSYAADHSLSLKVSEGVAALKAVQTKMVNETLPKLHALAMDSSRDVRDTTARGFYSSSVLLIKLRRFHLTAEQIVMVNNANSEEELLAVYCTIRKAICTK